MCPIVAELRSNTLLRRLILQLRAHLVITPIGSLDMNARTLALKHDINAAEAIAHARLTNHLNPRSDLGLVRAA